MSESLEDLLKALEEPDPIASAPPPTTSSQADLSTHELSDLIADLDSVTLDEPSPAIPDSSAVGSDLSDLLNELEADPVPPPSSSHSSTNLSAPVSDGVEELGLSLEETLAALDATSGEFSSKGGDDWDVGSLSPAKPPASNPPPSSGGLSMGAPPSDSMDSILANLNSSLSAVEAGDDSPIGKDILGLSSTSERDQEMSLRNLVNNALEDHIRVEMLNKGAIPPAVSLFKSPNKTVASLACHLLANMALLPQSRKVARSTPGAVVGLVGLLTDDSPRVVEKALSAIANLCVDDPENRAEFRIAGLTSRVISLLSSDNDDLVNRALTTIVNCSFDADSQRELLDSSGVFAIVQCLNTAQKKISLGDAVASQEEKQKNAIWALAALTMGGSAVQMALYEAGAIRHFVDVLKSSTDFQAQSKSLTALVNLSGNDAIQTRIREAGGIQAIVQKIGGAGNPNIDVLALQCVQNLAIDGGCRRELHNQGVVEKVLGCLRTSPQIQVHALRVVVNLTADTALRRGLVSAGAQGIVSSLLSSADPSIAAAARQANNNLSIPC